VKSNWKIWSGPAYCDVHVAPPFDVETIRPAPAAQPAEDDTNCTVSSAGTAAETPEFWTRTVPAPAQVAATPVGVPVVAGRPGVVGDEPATVEDGDAEGVVAPEEDRVLAVVPQPAASMASAVSAVSRVSGSFLIPCETLRLPQGLRRGVRPMDLR
jgi:hypothetical protein